MMLPTLARWTQRAARGRSTAFSRPAAAAAAPFSASTKRPTDDALPRVVSQEIIFENPWLRLKTIRFLDEAGAERQWTGLERTTTYPEFSPTVTTTTDTCDAVVVFPFLTRADTATEVVLIRQFRPPVGKWVIELPAGLIDDGEAPEEAAKRELEEETGFIASRVLHMGPPMVNDQGITNGTCRLLLMHVRHEDQPERQTQHLEADEMIGVVRAPLDGLIPWLLDRRATYGDAIDARLYSYALGLQAVPALLSKGK